MMMMHYEAIRNAAETEIRRLGDLALSTADRSLISKPGYDEAVTETDRKIENELARNTFGIPYLAQENLLPALLSFCSNAVEMND